MAFFTLKEEQRTAQKAFLSGEGVVKHCGPVSLPWGGDVHLMSPRAPIESLELILTGLNVKDTFGLPSSF